MGRAKGCSKGMVSGTTTTLLRTTTTLLPLVALTPPLDTHRHEEAYRHAYVAAERHEYLGRQA